MKNKSALWLLVVALLVTLPLFVACATKPAPAPTPAPTELPWPTLNAVKVTSSPTLDGSGTDSAWAGAPELNISPPGVKMKAVYTSTDLYILASYADTTASFTRSGSWSWVDGKWAKSEGQSEDRITVMWSMNTPGFDDTGCMVKCHPGSHEPGEEDDAWLEAGKADMWHMKAARCLGFNASQKGTPTVDSQSHEVTAGTVTLNGYIDDKYIGQWSADNAPDGGRYGDAGKSTYSNNLNKDKTAPLYIEKEPSDYMDAMFLSQSEIDAGETAEVTGLTSAQLDSLWVEYKALGAVVPERILRTPDGSRADVLEAATWSDGTWTVEFKRALNTGHPDDDVIFSDLTKAYPFGIATIDNGGGDVHKFSGTLALVFK